MRSGPSKTVTRGLLFGAVLLCSCSQSPPQPPDVVLIVVDTLRADHLGVYGYERATSPELDRFAQDAIVFDNVVSPAPWTLPAVASMLTSTYPTVHGLRSRGEKNARTRMRDGLPTLAGAFAEAGYRTVAVGTNPWVNTEGHGLQQGFEDYHALRDAGADAVNALAQEILEADDGRPVFLYLHYMDVHGPYPTPDVRVADLGPVAPRYVRGLTKRERRTLSRYLRMAGVTSLDGYLDAYDRGIRIWDGHFGELLSGLEARGRLAESVVAVTSDHGEEFLEHGGWNHGYTVYDEQIWVPWILRVPGSSSRRVGGLTSLIDVAPTLLAAAGLDLPGSMTGVNVLADDGPGPTRVVLSETHIRGGDAAHQVERPLAAMRRGHLKWIVDRDVRRCFDLVEDPREANPARCDEAGFEELAARIDQLVQHAKALGHTGEFESSPEQQEQLRQLGYLE